MIEYEEQLIAHWLSGNNREHIKEFDSFNWFDPILQALKKCNDLDDFVAIGKVAKISPSELHKIVGKKFSNMYEPSYRHIKLKQVRLRMTGLVDSANRDEVQDLLQEMDKLIAPTRIEPANVADAFMRELEKRKTAEVLKYGIPTLDELTGGLRRQEFTVIAARPSVGKTALALQIAYDLALAYKNVMFFSLEMSASQLMERIVCRTTTVRHHALKLPKNLTKDEQKEVVGMVESFRESISKNLLIMEGVRNLSAIRECIKDYKPDIVFIDQLSQVREDRRFNTFREQFSYRTGELKAMTMELDVPIILMVQINRDAQNREPTLADLKESGSIEEDSDNVLLLHKADKEGWGQVPVDLIIAKQRNGPKDRIIPLTFNGPRFDFKEIATMY